VEFNHFLYLVEKMTEVKTVKISKETYAKLSEIAGELQMKLKRPVSLDEAMRYLLEEKRLKPSDFAGAWNMSEEEEAEVFKSLREMWSRWKLPKE